MSDFKTTKKRCYIRLTWDDWYLLAKEFYISEHHLRIPVKYKTPNGFLLGRWIERQRAAYHQRGTYKIDARRIYLLNQIEMIWTVGVRTKWDVWYGYCKEYYLHNGNIDIPKDFICNHVALGEWIGYQRKCFHKKKLSSQKRIKLEALGMNWQIRNRKSDIRI